MDPDFLLSLLILPAVVIGGMRFAVIDRAYRPFLYYVFISVVNEVISYLMKDSPKGYQLADLNVFALLEYLLLLWQAYCWRLFDRYPALFYALLGGFSLFWVAENLIFSVLTRYHLWFILLRSFVVVLLSIHVINRVVTDVSVPVYRNARFIICTGFVIFFTYFTVMSALFLVNDKTLGAQFFRIQVYVNSLANLLYAAGAWFIPRKTRDIRFVKAR